MKVEIVYWRKGIKVNLKDITRKCVKNTALWYLLFFMTVNVSNIPRFLVSKYLSSNTCRKKLFFIYVQIFVNGTGKLDNGM